MIVPMRLYKPQRQIVRTEPLIIVEGRLERHANGGGAINLLAKTIGRPRPLVRRPPLLGSCGLLKRRPLLLARTLRSAGSGIPGRGRGRKGIVV